MKRFLFYILVLFLSSCMTMKPSGVNSGKNNFETFFVGEEGTMYFIKPIAFYGSDDKELEMDFTFNYKTEVVGTASIKFSIFDQHIYKCVDSLIIQNANCSLSISNPSFLFNERKKSNFKSRFEAQTYLANLLPLFEQSDWQMDIYTPEGMNSFVNRKKGKEIIESLDYTLFVLMK